MKLIRRTGVLTLTLSVSLALGCASTPRETNPRSMLRLKNNHELPYHGPVRLAVGLPDGSYRGPQGAGEVRSGVARVVASLPAESELVLSRVGPLQDHPFREGSFSIESSAARLDLSWAKERLGSLDLGLVVVPGTEAGPEDAVRAFEALPIDWTEGPGGVLTGAVRRDGYALELEAAPYGGGWLDVRARLVRADPASAPAYVALVRRVTSPGMSGVRQRFNGRVLDVADSPDVWERDFWYTHGVDWISWKAGRLSLAAVNGFAPVPTIQRNGAWAEGSHFYVWERTRREGDGLYLISEVAGPNPGQARSGYMPVTEYAPMRAGDAVEMRWRLALAPEAGAGWEESQLRAFAGYRAAEEAGGVVDLGVPGVVFGTSYFPYSTFAENFDFYRTPGLDKETWWPSSAEMWKGWRSYVPRMRTDLHIIRAMGFDRVRLHHLELLARMDRAEALAFLDFYTQTARELGLEVLADSEGPEEWIAQVAGRYRGIITGLELENEILIQGIKPGDAERWSALYRAAKRAAPETEVFLTTAGNHAMFERLRDLGVPFDRVGLHAYSHDLRWVEAFSSHALGTGGYASGLGKRATLGEFNWKGLTRLSPEARRKEFATIYETMLKSRAIPEFFQFHFQETLSVNPSISRSGIRHYETIALDRRPKPEALELMRLIREHARPGAPVREVSLELGEARIVDGRASVPFTVANRTQRELALELSALAFEGVEPRLASAERVTLRPGSQAEGRIEVRLAPGAVPGTYHHFVRAAYDGKAAYGWGVLSNPGAPEFEAEPVLEGRVVYPQGADVVERLVWTRPLAVAFGPDAPVLEMEMAYLVANTLQSATGRPVRLSSTADLPDSLLTRGTLVLVGTDRTNPLVGSAWAGSEAAQGVVQLHAAEGGAQWLLLAGRDREAVQAAATDFVLRYWKNAKDAAIRITGMEEGAALGNRAGVTNVDPP